MGALKMFRAAILLAYLFSAFAISQNYTPILRNEVVTFTLRDSGTVWDIWVRYGGAPWMAFYDATAKLNPTEAEDRFTSVPIGSLISIPTSVLQARFVDVFGIEEFSATSEALVLEEELGGLSSAVLSQSSSVQSLSSSVETLEEAVETLEATLAVLLTSTTTPPTLFLGLTRDQWLLVAIVTLLILILLTLLFLTVRSQNRHKETIPTLQEELSHYSVVEPKDTNNEERDSSEINLLREVRELRERNEILIAEKEQLESLLASYEEDPEAPVIDGSTRKTRRGTHGRGRSYKNGNSS